MFLTTLTKLKENVVNIVTKTIFFVLLITTLPGCESIKEAGTVVGHTTRDVTREIGHASRDAVKEVGKEIDKVN